MTENLKRSERMVQAYSVTVKVVSYWKCSKCDSIGKGDPVEINITHWVGREGLDHTLKREVERINVRRMPVGWQANGERIVLCPKCKSL